MANATGIRTRSGIIPYDRALPYSVTTQDVQEYLRKRVSAMVEASEGRVPKYDITVISVEASKKYIPFAVVLPIDVLGDNQEKANDDIEYIFNQKNNDKNEYINAAYYKLLASYKFDYKKDGSMFSSYSWQNDNAVPRRAAANLIRYINPKIQPFYGSKTVMMLIDPLRIFHDMMTSNEDKRPFKITIEGLTKIENGKYRYSLVREINPNKGKKFVSIADQVNAVIRH